MINQTISHYKVLEKLGEGGMGIVYKAEDTKLKRTVALKFLPKGLEAHEPERARFLQEAQAASALNHPNICAIHTLGEHEGSQGDKQQFIDMEYVDGKTLRQLIVGASHDSPLPINEAITYAIQISEALQEAHSHSIVHRDVKPENIMVNTKNQIKVMDFGLAKLKGSLKLTRTSSTVGTLAYMAPEQIQGVEVDARSDIFSFGIVLFEMLTGRLPFRGEHGAAMMYSIINESPLPIQSVRMDIPISIQKIVDKCLSKEKNNRYHTADDLIHDLHQAQGELRSPSPKVANHSRKWLWIVMNFLIVFLALAIYLLVPEAPSVAETKSIVVLPFVDMSPSKDQEYFCDGTTEELINALTKLPNLHVASRTSAFQFKGKEIDVRTIGEKLNVSTVLEGSIRKSGNTLRITAQLINAINGYHLWSETYDRPLDDVFSIQEDISRSIANALKLKLFGEKAISIVKRYTDNIEAYNLYLKGRYYWNKRNEAGLKRGLEYFQNAVNEDSNYAPAHTGIADSYLALIDWGYWLPLDGYPKAMEAIKTALKLDPNLVEAQTSLAYLTGVYRRDAQNAEQEYKKAIALDEKYATAHQWYAEFLMSMGRITEALVEIKKSQQLDPLSLIMMSFEGRIYYTARDFDKSIQQCTKVLEIDSNFYPARAFLFFSCVQAGQDVKAIAAHRKIMLLENVDKNSLNRLDSMVQKDGIKGGWLWWLHWFEEKRLNGYYPAERLAWACSALGEKDSALYWINKAIDEHSPGILEIRVDPTFDILRSDPRFEALVKKIGLFQ